jgi:Thoeris protein ThsB, TIR-like domain
MPYKNGTYVAFDGLGTTDPTKSDIRFYNLIKGWDAKASDNFTYVDSHAKTSQVRDSSQEKTLKTKIRERLNNSKNILIILSSDTRKSGSMLSYEIEYAVDTLKLPLIIAYVDYKVVATPLDLSSYWPTVLHDKMKEKVIVDGEKTDEDKVKAIHIPFIKDVVLSAISRFDIKSKLLSSKKFYFDKDAHVSWKIIKASSAFKNTKK